MKKRLSARDAYLLAMVAERPGMPDAIRKRVLAETKSRRIKAIVIALCSGKVVDAKGDIATAAKGLRLWAERNKAVHSADAVGGRKKRRR